MKKIVVLFALISVLTTAQANIPTQEGILGLERASVIYINIPKLYNSLIDLASQVQNPDKDASAVQVEPALKIDSNLMPDQLAKNFLEFNNKELFLPEKGFLLAFDHEFNFAWFIKAKIKPEKLIDYLKNTLDLHLPPYKVDDGQVSFDLINSKIILTPEGAGFSNIKDSESKSDVFSKNFLKAVNSPKTHLAVELSGEFLTAYRKALIAQRPQMAEDILFNAIFTLKGVQLLISEKQINLFAPTIDKEQSDLIAQTLSTAVATYKNILSKMFQSDFDESVSYDEMKEMFSETKNIFNEFIDSLQIIHKPNLVGFRAKGISTESFALFPIMMGIVGNVAGNIGNAPDRQSAANDVTQKPVDDLQHREIEVISVKGRASVEKVDEYQQLLPGQVLTGSYVFQTEQGAKVELRLLNNNRISLLENTEIKIQPGPCMTNDNIEDVMTLINGKVLVNISINGRGSLCAKIGSTLFNPSSGTSKMIFEQEAGNGEVIVKNGLVEVLQTSEEPFRISGFYKVDISGDHVSSPYQASIINYQW